MAFLPPINIGSFKPAPATLAQWVYDIWQYLQENPIATQEDITTYIQNYFETSPEVQTIVGEVVAQYLLDNPPQAPVQSVQGKTGAVSLTYPDIVPASNAVPVYRAATAPNTSTAQGLYNNGYRLFVNTATQEIFTISNSGALTLVGRGRFDGTTVDLDTAQGDTTIAEAVSEISADIETLSGDVANSIKSIQAVDFTFESKNITGGNYGEWTNVDISRSGWTPLAVSRVSTNRSNLVVSGFAVFSSNNTAYLMIKNVSDTSQTASNVQMTVVYYKR